MSSGCMPWQRTDTMSSCSGKSEVRGCLAGCASGPKHDQTTNERVCSSGREV
jgi:hypothetical protein